MTGILIRTDLGITELVVTSLGCWQNKPALARHGPLFQGGKGLSIRSLQVSWATATATTLPLQLVQKPPDNTQMIMSSCIPIKLDLWMLKFEFQIIFSICEIVLIFLQPFKNIKTSWLPFIQTQAASCTWWVNCSWSTTKLHLSRASSEIWQEFARLSLQTPVRYHDSSRNNFF